jgi:hypothetical protein
MVFFYGAAAKWHSLGDALSTNVAKKLASLDKTLANVFTIIGW